MSDSTKWFYQWIAWMLKTIIEPLVLAILAPYLHQLQRAVQFTETCFAISIDIYTTERAGSNSCNIFPSWETGIWEQATKFCRKILFKQHHGSTGIVDSYSWIPGLILCQIKNKK